MTTPSDAWPALRAAVAQAAVSHWRALRAIAPSADPRIIAAESVATCATSLMQCATLHEAVAFLELAQDETTTARSLRAAITAAPITAADLAQLGRQVDALDAACAAWTASAYGISHQAERLRPAEADNRY